MTDLYAVAGHPVAHSQSPFIHALFARQTGETLAYGRLLCPLDGFATTVRQFARGEVDVGVTAPASADGWQPAGCNVTVPFKFEAFALAPRHTPRAALAQAANTLRFDAEGWLADNTDGAGLVRDIEHNAGQPLAGRSVLLIGAGGAAAGVLGPLLMARPATLVLANRTLGKALDLVTRHASLARELGVSLQACALTDCQTVFDIVINASASSLGGGAIPVTAQVLGPDTLALDMMYGPAAQPFLQWATAHGAQARDGLGMLVEQAAEAFWVWRGVRPQTPEVLLALRQRMAGAAP